MMRMNTKTKLAIARSAYVPVSFARRVVGFGDVTRVRRNGFMWELDLGEGIEFTIYLLGAFERETVRAYERILRPGDTVLDIGAHIGAHTLPMARCVGAEGRVIAIEPTVSAFQKLTKNIAANLDICDRVRAVRAYLIGLDDERLAALSGGLFSSWPLRSAEGLHPIHRGRLESTEGSERVTIDTLLERFAIPKVHFVKMDIDGMECTVLSGAQRLLEQHRPRFIMELLPYGLEEHGASLDELVGIFYAQGYTFTDLHGASLSRNVGELAASIPPGGSRNVLAFPQ
ncbi:FkbM family methyltransferase [Candidatus Uhrbacteria bacterium]|nr:FkbM family methyltransferase [Candidatus Uhrbacteria bacterium]